MKLCEYGCGLEAKHQLKNKKWCCSSHSTKCTAIRHKNSAGVSKAHTEGRVFEFSEASRTKSNENSTLCAIERHFSYPSESLNSWITKELVEFFKVPYVCAKCGISKWNGIELTLDLDHKNGISNDNRYINLHFLCPNCHSQTESFRGKNINNGKKKVEDDILYADYLMLGNIRRVLLKHKLAAKGGNYERLYKIIAENENGRS